MAFAVTHYETSGDAANQQSYTTGSFTPNSDEVLFACFSSRTNTVDDDTISSTHSGLSWTKVGTVFGDIGTNEHRQTVWIADTGSTPGAGTITFDAESDGAQSFGLWSVFSISDSAAAADAIVQSKSADEDPSDTSLRATFDSSVSSGNAVVAVATHRSGGAFDDPSSPDGLTLIGDSGEFDTRAIGTGWESSPSDDTAGMSWATTANYALLLLFEVKAAGPTAATISENRSDDETVVIDVDSHDDLNVDHTELHRSTTSGFTPSASTLVQDDITPSQGDTITDHATTADSGASGPSADVTYYYVLRDWEDAGETAFSDSNELEVTTAYARPTSLTQVTQGSDYVVVEAAVTDPGFLVDDRVRFYYRESGSSVIWAWEAEPAQDVSGGVVQHRFDNLTGDIDVQAAVWRDSDGAESGRSSEITATLSTAATATPDPRLAALEVWSDVEAAGGQRLAVFSAVVSASDRETLDNDDWFRVTVARNDSAYTHVVEQRVCRAVELDGSYTEWRIRELRETRERSGSRVAEIRCASILDDLRARSGFVARTEADGFTDLDFTLLNLSAEEWVDTILASYRVPGWIGKGVIEPTARLSLAIGAESGDSPLDSPLAALRALVSALEEAGISAELDLRRNGTADYRVDILTERGSDQDKVLVAKGRQLLSATRESDASRLTTRATPIGSGPRGSRLSMGNATWKVSAVDTGDDTVDLTTPDGASIDIIRMDGLLCGPNLLGSDAEAEHTGVANYNYQGRTDADPIPIAKLGLSVGDTISFGGEAKADGVEGSHFTVRFYDTNESVLSASTTANITATSYGKKYNEGVSVPASTVYIAMFGEATDQSSGTNFWRRAMLVKGSTFPDHFVSSYAYLERANGTTTEITWTDAGNDRLWVLDSSNVSQDDLVHVRRNSSGDQLLDLWHPSRVLTYGYVDASVSRPDIVGVDNLVSDPFLTDWSGNTPNQYTVLGGATVTKNTDRLYWQSGGSSAKVVCSSDGDGIETNAIDVSPTETNPYYTAQCRFRISALDTSAKVVVQLEDVTNGTKWPARTVDAGAYDQLTWHRWSLPPTVNANDESIAQFKISVTTRGGGGTFYADAFQLVRSIQAPESFYEGYGSNRLWDEAQRVLDSDFSLPRESISVQLVDLNRLLPDDFPHDEIAVGGTAILKDDGLGLDEELRFVERERNLLKGGETKVSLKERRETLAALTVAGGRRPALDFAPPSSGADQTAGRELGVLDASLAPVASFADVGRWMVPNLSGADPAGAAAVNLEPGDVFVGPVAVQTTSQISELKVGTANDPGSFRFVLYRGDGTGYPGNLIYSSSVQTADGSSDVTVTGLAIDLKIGVTYWIGILCTAQDSGTTGVGFDSHTEGPPLAGLNDSDTEGLSYKSTGNGTTAPDPFPASPDSYLTNCPYIRMKRAA